MSAAVVVWGSIAAVGAWAGSPAPRISAGLPSSATVGRAVSVRGRVTRAPSASTAELEGSGAPGGWRVLAKGAIKAGGRFGVVWVPRAAGFEMIRVVVVHRGERIASTKAGAVAVGAAPIYCAAARRPGSLPAGDGYIVGGVYNVGGPAPGITVCEGQVNTVSVADSAGRTVATASVAAGQSYGFVVPAGSYKLSAGFCRGSATVRAGATTTADTVCPVP